MRVWIHVARNSLSALLGQYTAVVFFFSMEHCVIDPGVRAADWLRRNASPTLVPIPWADSPCRPRSIFYEWSRFIHVILDRVLLKGPIQTRQQRIFVNNSNHKTTLQVITITTNNLVYDLIKIIRTNDFILVHQPSCFFILIN